MNNWEERISQRAPICPYEWEVIRIAMAREREDSADEEAQIFEQNKINFEKGPPDGCHECYTWSTMPLGVRVWWHWRSFEINECNHECHRGIPHSTVPIIFG